MLPDTRRAGRYARIREQLVELFAKTRDPGARMATVVALLHHKMPHFFWAGFYLLKNDALIMGPYQGPLACAVLPGPEGVCWTAVQRGESILVPDVHAFAGHVTCNTRSRSEVVVPLRDTAGRIVGVLDVDSEKPAAFGDVDVQGLEALVSLILAEAPAAPMASNVREALRGLLIGQPLSVLATYGPEGPHASLLAFAATDECGEVVFVTPRKTRKYVNLRAEGRAALLIDNRTNAPTDFADAMAATASGPVQEITGAERAPYARVFLQRHPDLVSFLESTEVAFLKMTVERYSVVRRFREVTEVRPPIRAT